MGIFARGVGVQKEVSKGRAEGSTDPQSLLQEGLAVYLCHPARCH